MQSQRKLLILQNISLKENFCNFLWLFHNIFTPDHMCKYMQRLLNRQSPNVALRPNAHLYFKDNYFYIIVTSACDCMDIYFCIKRTAMRDYKDNFARVRAHARIYN